MGTHNQIAMTYLYIWVAIFMFPQAQSFKSVPKAILESSVAAAAVLALLQHLGVLGVS
jgi:hypothetical protein